MRKRLFISLLAVLFVAGIAFAQQRGSSSDPGVGDILGQKGLQDQGNKIFRMVRYVPPTWSGSDALATESIVVWDLSSDDGVTVTTTTVSCDSAVAGIIVAQALTPQVDGNTAAQDRGKRNWTWLQTYGVSQVRVESGADINTAGDAMGTSTVAGEATFFDVNNTTNPRAMGNAGFFYDTASASDDDVEVFIRLD